MLGTAAAKLMLPANSRLLPTFCAFTVIAGAVTVAVICVLVVGSVLNPDGAAIDIVDVPAPAGWKLTPPALVEPPAVNVTCPLPVIVPVAVFELLNVTLTGPPACGPTVSPQFTAEVRVEFHAHIDALNAVAGENVVVVKLPWLITNPDGTIVIVPLPVAYPDAEAVSVTPTEPGPVANPCPCK